MPHRVPRAARLACGAVKVSVVAVLLGLGLGTGPDAAVGEQDHRVEARQPVDAHPDPLDRKLAERQCSTRGFDDGRQPASALVRSARGTLRFVDFDTGWAIYTRHGAATLVAVCLAEPPARRSGAASASR